MWNATEELFNTLPTNGPATRPFNIPGGQDVLTADFGFDGGGIGGIAGLERFDGFAPRGNFLRNTGPASPQSVPFDSLCFSPARKFYPFPVLDDGDGGGMIGQERLDRLSLYTARNRRRDPDIYGYCG